MKIMVDIDYETNKVFFYCDVMFVFEAIPNWINDVPIVVGSIKFQGFKKAWEKHPLSNYKFYHLFIPLMLS